MDALPRVISSTNLSELRRLHPVKSQISLKIQPPSTATLTVIDEEAVAIGDWIRLYTPQGDAGVYYVKSLSTDYTTHQQTVSLEHCYGLLDESLLWGKHEPPKISGRTGATKVAASTCITYVLGKQNTTVWALDQCDATEEQGWNFNGDTIRDAMDKVMKALYGYEWRFDMSSLPFKLSLVRQDSAFSAQVRESRNANGIQVKLDKSSMFTRVYPIGKNDLNISSINNNQPYIENADAVALYGVISACVSDNGISDKSSLKRFGEAQLAKNCRPAMTITIDGLELSQLTGEPLDRLTVGARCRIPLPQYGVTFEDRITEVSWSDSVGNPYGVKVTLSTSRKTLQSVLWQRNRSGGGASRNRESDINDCQLGTETVRQSVVNIGSAQTRVSILAKDITMNGKLTIAGGGYLYYSGSSVYKKPITVLNSEGTPVTHYVLAYTSGDAGRQVSAEEVGDGE